MRKDDLIADLGQELMILSNKYINEEGLNNKDVIDALNLMSWMLGDSK